jgi:LysM repeat protein
MTPYVVGGLAALLVIAGVVILVFALRPGGFAPTPTATPTLPPPTVTVVAPTATQKPPTAIPTATVVPATPTTAITNTPTGPFEYTVQANDTCWDIAYKFKVDLNTLLALNNFPPGQCPIAPQQKIMVPAPGQLAPTPTAVDVSKLLPGTMLEYTIQTGDTLRAIALRYNSTQNAIMTQNKMTDPNKLVAGTKILIPVNIATTVPTTTDTPTPKPGTPSATVAPTKAATATATKAP